MYGKLKNPEEYGAWTRAIKAWFKKTIKKARHWFCKVGLCTLNKCGCKCHEEKNDSE